jgi:hypothetical protein
MERLPDSLAIGLWITGSCWALALVASVFGAFKELTGGRFVTLGRSDLSRLLFEKIRDTTETIFSDEIVSLQE